MHLCWQDGLHPREEQPFLERMVPPERVPPYPEPYPPYDLAHNPLRSQAVFELTWPDRPGHFQHAGWVLVDVATTMCVQRVHNMAARAAWVHTYRPPALPVVVGEQFPPDVRAAARAQHVLLVEVRDALARDIQLVPWNLQAALGTLAYPDCGGAARGGRSPLGLPVAARPQAPCAVPARQDTR